MDFDEVDEPATDDEINQWWSRHGVRLVGFTAAARKGSSGLIHWIALARNQAERTELYYLCLCGTMNDELSWTRVPGADVTCMTCLVRASRERWREPG